MARPTRLPMAEALRTIGGLLEPQAVPRVKLWVAADGVTVDSRMVAGGRAYTWDALVRESEEQQQQRQAGGDAASWVAPLALTRWPALLRIVGQLLDTRHLFACEIDASLAPLADPRDCQVRVMVGDDVLVDGDDVQLHLLRVRTGQIAQQQPHAPRPGDAASRPWWAIWRRD